MTKYSHSRGLSIVEIVVTATIIVTVVTAAAGTWQLYLRVSGISTKQSQASIITGESAEAIRLLRDQSWTKYISPLNLGTTYQLYWNGNEYQATTTQILIQDQFVRTLVFSAVNRDSNDNVSSSGTPDPNTKKVTISVFDVGATSTPIMQTEMLISNVYSN